MGSCRILLQMENGWPSIGLPTGTRGKGSDKLSPIHRGCNYSCGSITHQASTSSKAKRNSHVDQWPLRQECVNFCRITDTLTADWWVQLCAMVSQSAQHVVPGHFCVTHKHTCVKNDGQFRRCHFGYASNCRIRRMICIEYWCSADDSLIRCNAGDESTLRVKLLSSWWRSNAAACLHMCVHRLWCSVTHSVRNLTLAKSSIIVACVY